MIAYSRDFERALKELDYEQREAFIETPGVSSFTTTWEQILSVKDVFKSLLTHGVAARLDGAHGFTTVVFAGSTRDAIARVLLCQVHNS